jgi:hypothetical protein
VPYVPKLRCPNGACEEPEGPFHVEYVGFSVIDSDGDDVTEDYGVPREPEAEDPTTCSFCGHEGKFKDFKFGPEGYICYPPKERR